MMTKEEAINFCKNNPEAAAKIILMVEELKLQIKELEARLGMNSSNSSKPPSTDNKLTKQPPKKSINKKAKRGGQHGHKGVTLTQSATPDCIEVIKPTICSACQHSLEDSHNIKVIKRQVFDIPKASITIKEYQGHSITCPHCHHKNHAQFPQGVNGQAQYGTNIQAFVSYLHSYHMTPHERITKLIEDIYSHKLSEGSIITMLQRTHGATLESEVRIKELLKESSLIHCDETGMSVNGKLHWVHVASTSYLTHLHLHKRRGQEAMDAMDILPNYTGTVVSDHWASYKNYTKSSHSFCNAHHLRELNGITQTEDVKWSQDMYKLLLGAYKAVNKSKRNAKTALHPRVIDYFTKQYDVIIEAALHYYQSSPSPPIKPHKRHKQCKGKNLLDRLIKHKTETLRFINDFSVPFTNNQAEQDLRMIKVKEKISGTVASMRGGEYFVRIRSYISTVKKQGAKIFDELVNALNGKPFLPQLEVGC